MRWWRLGGVAGDIPLTANFSGPGELDDIVIYRAGMWYVDTNLNGSVNLTYMLGGVARRHAAGGRRQW